MKETIDALEGLDVHKVIIAGADPCQLDDNLIDLIEYIYLKGLEIKNIQTHARSFIDKNFVRELQRVNRGFAVIAPIYGSTSEIHNRVVRPRIGDAFQETILGLENCVASGIQIRVNTRILQENIDDMDNIIKLSRTIHAQKVYIGWVAGQTLSEDAAFAFKQSLVERNSGFVIDVDNNKKHGPNIVLNTRHIY